VLAAIASVQSGSAVARHLFHLAGPAGITLRRLGLAALLLGLVVRPTSRGLSRDAIVSAVLFGLVLAGMNLSFYEAIDSVPLGVAVTVEFIGPMAVALAGARRWTHVVWVLLAAGGVLLLAESRGQASARGLALAALAGAFWGGYILASQRVGRLIPGTVGLALALPVATLAVLPFGIVPVVRGVADRPVVLAGGLAVAMLSSVIPYSLELAALRRLSTTVFGVLMSLEPAGAALAGFLILGQRLTLRQAAALVLVSIASVGITVTDRNRARAAAMPPVQPLE
jgi:inner membrane transporter RhtA